ncbi:MAG: hypothetical protein FJ109_13415 [Deltaproteobacteria bacterium]|nr:hypothetical protein [Deltaproteobacteria bacterium]
MVKQLTSPLAEALLTFVAVSLGCGGTVVSSADSGPDAFEAGAETRAEATVTDTVPAEDIGPATDFGTPDDAECEGMWCGAQGCAGVPAAKAFCRAKDPSSCMVIDWCKMLHAVAWYADDITLVVNEACYAFAPGEGPESIDPETEILVPLVYEERCWSIVTAFTYAEVCEQTESNVKLHGLALCCGKFSDPEEEPHSFVQFVRMPRTKTWGPDSHTELDGIYYAPKGACNVAEMWLDKTLGGYAEP